MFFYKEQRNRGDILAVPQVLCEPGMEGQPLVAAPFDSDDDENYQELASIRSVREDTGSVSRRSIGSGRGGAAGLESDMAAIAAAALALPRFYLRTGRQQCVFPWSLVFTERRGST